MHNTKDISSLFLRTPGVCVCMVCVINSRHDRHTIPIASLLLVKIEAVGKRRQISSPYGMCVCACVCNAASPQANDNVFNVSFLEEHKCFSSRDEVWCALSLNQTCLQTAIEEGSKMRLEGRMHRLCFYSTISPTLPTIVTHQSVGLFLFVFWSTSGLTFSFDTSFRCCEPVFLVWNELEAQIDESY